MFTEIFQGPGIQFRYPSEWQLLQQEDGHEITVSVNAPETSSWTITLLFDRPDPEQVLNTAVDAFREEYDELDVYSSRAELCHQQTLAKDIEFVCLELLNTAYLRVFRTGRFTALVMYQGNDEELEETRPVLESISNSLVYDFGDELIIG